MGGLFHPSHAIEDLSGRSGIDRCRGFVSNNKKRVADQSLRYSKSLPLASAQLMWIGIVDPFKFGQSNRSKQCPHLIPRLVQPIGGMGAEDLTYLAANPNNRIENAGILVDRFILRLLECRGLRLF